MISETVLSVSHLSYIAMDTESPLACFIKSNLPSLREVEPLLEVLLELGVQDLKDLGYIQESDLLHILKPVEVRKLLSLFKTTSTCFNLCVIQLSYKENMHSKRITLY